MIYNFGKNIETSKQHYELAKKLFRLTIERGSIKINGLEGGYEGFNHYKLNDDLFIGFIRNIDIDNITEYTIRFFGFIQLYDPTKRGHAISNPLLVKNLPQNFLKECLYYAHLNYEITEI